MIYVLLYDCLEPSFFLQHVLLLNRFTKLRIGRESYGTMLGKQSSLLNASFISMPDRAPDDARKMLSESRQTLLAHNTNIKNDDRIVVFNMRYYPVDCLWFNHMLEKMNLTDIPLVILHDGHAALIGARWSGGTEDMETAETALIENTRDRLVDIGQTDNVLRIVSSNFSLRYFNRLCIGNPGYFHKRSTNIQKVHAEHEFLSALPAQVRPFFPVVGDIVETAEEGGYEIEIIPSLDVAKLLLNGRFTIQASIDILISSLETYLGACPKRQCTQQEYFEKMRDMFIIKTQERLNSLAGLSVGVKLDLTCRMNGFDSLEHFTSEYIELCEKSIATESSRELVFSHGDLFFANILFDPLTGKIKLVDPKGGAGDTAFLPAWYDLAKLSHSFLGRYDMLVHDEFSVSMENDLSLCVHTVDMPGSDDLEKRFLEFLRRKGVDLKKTRIFEAALFLSMLPLHTDFPLRMQGQLLRALDIYKRVTTPGAPLCGVWTK